MFDMNNTKIGIIGLGYVGLPLAVEFGKILPTFGLDNNSTRITELKEGKDSTLEVDLAELQQAKQLHFTDQPEGLRGCNFYIITVPTPIDEYKRPDLSPLISASQTLSKLIQPGDVAVFESTVYPGATEEVCVPILEQGSGLKFNQDFFVGYSPERINPGDKKHRLPDILKVTSGSTPEIAEKVDQLYREIITAGTFKAASIKVAEAAKVIENAQRDINIAFVNELALIFDRLGIDTLEVLEAAGTKWNFLPFKPGLVGGHCIGVDPYYLTHKAQEVGYNPEIILAGRRLNDNMGIYVANQVIKLMIKKGQKIEGSKVLVLGITFKENCPDIRNSRVIDVIEELKEFGCDVDVYDPWADKEEVKREYNLELICETPQELGPNSKLNIQNKQMRSDESRYFLENYNAVIFAVAHDEYLQIKKEDLAKLSEKEKVIIDIKGIIENPTWRL
ncbi:MAG: Vi polysaccharide biosynthesis UDP-N-acetylglucosamine C-6 dehydrogenase TviB [Campylobacteraceae bacterium]|nr:Vi polysaccharide biosynthesis UDP-N-acetylglucosamine C-6 dehydrogenase TviB [Campylobacteraceae bacterium]